MLSLCGKEIHPLWDGFTCFLIDSAVCRVAADILYLRGLLFLKFDITVVINE